MDALTPPEAPRDERDVVLARRRRCAASSSTGEPTVVQPPPTNGHDAPAGPGRDRPRLAAAPPRAQPRGRRSSGCGSKSVSISYGEKVAVDDVTLPVRQGEVLALIGPSGCGKTTLLRSLNRLVEITPTAVRGGRITLDGEDIDAMEVTALRRRVSMVFQQPNPFPMSVFDNVAYALREQGSRRPGKDDAAATTSATRCVRAGLWDEVGATLDHPALRLSGGQQQRLCIARALAARPEVLLLDEPCSALDPRSTQVIEELILQAARRGRGRDRHPQHAAGAAHRRPRRLHVPRRAGRVRAGRAGLRRPARSAHPRVRRRCVRMSPRSPLPLALALAGVALVVDRLRIDPGQERQDRRRTGPGQAGEGAEDHQAEQGRRGRLEHAAQRRQRQRRRRPPAQPLERGPGRGADRDRRARRQGQERLPQRHPRDRAGAGGGALHRRPAARSSGCTTRSSPPASRPRSR